MASQEPHYTLRENSIWILFHFFTKEGFYVKKKKYMYVYIHLVIVRMSFSLFLPIYEGTDSSDC